MKRILFVDDEAAILRGLQRMLRPLRDQWAMQFAEGGPAALELLATQTFDVVVSDVRMPGMDGVSLLTELKRLHPEVVRIILSGHSDHEMILRSIGPAHQFLTKPCSPELLRATVERACSLQDRLNDPELQKLASRMGSLPSVPTLYNQIMAEVSSPAGSLENVGRIISQDMAMTAKVLQLVNSAFFGVRQRVSDPALAVRFLGLETIQALVLSVQVFSSYERDPRCERAVRELWSSSTRVAAFARIIAREQGAPRAVIDQAFFAGMLHDIGLLLLLAHSPEHHAEVERRMQEDGHAGIEDIERSVFGGTHADLGAFLLGIWGLPGTIVEAVAFHHRPSLLASAEFGPLTCVHAAGAIAEGLEGVSSMERTAWDDEYLQRLGLSERVPVWIERCADASNAEAA